MRKRSLLTLSLSFILALAGCGLCCASAFGAEPNGEPNVRTIEMSAEARAMIDTLGTEMGSKYFRKDAFESKMRPTYQNRSAYPGLPSADAKGTAIACTNQPKDTLYGQNHVYTFTPKKYDRVIMYVHGGAYVNNAASVHVKFCDLLATELNAKVYLPLYSLAPQGTWKEGYALLDAVWKDVLAEKKPAFIMGDSAGGGLALGFTEELAETGASMPKKMVLLSPWVDVEMKDPAIAAYADKDTSLSSYGLVECGKMWADKLSTHERRISPLFYNGWKKLPETLLFVGNAEIFYPDDTELCKKLAAAGVHVSKVVGNGLFHVFPVYTNIPESAESRRIIKEFIEK